MPDFRDCEKADVDNSEAWKSEGMYTRRNRFSNAFPGLGIAMVAFAGYCLYDYMFADDGHHGHGDSHGDAHNGKH